MKRSLKIMMAFLIVFLLSPILLAFAAVDKNPSAGTIFQDNVRLMPGMGITADGLFRPVAVTADGETVLSGSFTLVSETYPVPSSGAVYVDPGDGYKYQATPLVGVDSNGDFVPLLVNEDGMLQTSGGGGGGGGDVNGPVSSTDGQVALFEGTDGKEIKTGAFYSTNNGTQFGINNSSPADNVLALYKMGNGADTWRNFETVLVVPSSGAGAYHEALYAGVRADHDTGTLDLLRNYLTAEFTGDGVVTETYGARAISRLYDYDSGGGDTATGIITNSYGLEAYSGNLSAAGIIRNSFGIYISRSHATGSDGGGGAHTAVGLKIDNVVASGGDSNVAWTIDTAGSDAPSRFGADLYPETQFAQSLGSYSLPWQLAWVGGVKFRGNGFAIQMETENLAADYQLRLPNSYNAGKAWVATSSGNTEFGEVSFVQLTNANALTCNSSNRRKMRVVEGGSSVADQVEICLKDASDAYAWEVLSLVP